MDSPTETTALPGPAPTPPPTPPGWPGPRRLRRRPDAGPIGGVCAGLAEYFNVDPVLVRIIAVVLALSGPGVVAYALAWIFVPAETGPGSGGTDPTEHRGGQIFGLVLLALAASVLLGDWWSPGRHLAFPLGLMALGAWLLLRRDAADVSPPPTLGARAEPLRADPLTATPDATAPLGANPGDLGDPGADATGWESSPTPWAAPTLPSPPQPSAAAARRRLVGPLVLGTLLGWAGVAWLLGVAVTTGLAVALVIIGGGIVMGGSRLLIVPALLIGGALGMAAVVDIPLSGPVGQQVWAPLSVADVDSPYELSVGEGTLDLSAIDLPAGKRLTVDASVGIGQLVVLVPSDLALDVDTNVGLGDSQVLDIHREGVGLSTDQFDEQGAVGGTLVLHLQAGIGQIEVRRAGPLVDRGTTPTTVMR